MMKLSLRYLGILLSNEHCKWICDASVNIDLKFDSGAISRVSIFP